MTEKTTNANSSPQARTKLLTRVGLITASILFSLVAAELLTRLVLPDISPARKGRLQFWEYDSTLGWKHKANQRDRFIHPAFDVEVAINSAGLRDDEFDFSTIDTHSERRILVLGDSFGWGFGVEHAERFDTLLEQRHPGWNLINASVSGYGTDQQYLWLRENGVKYRAKAVLLLLYQNDFANNSAKEQYWYYKPRFRLINGQLELFNVPVPDATFRQHVQRFIAGQTYLYGYLYKTVFTPLNLRYQAGKIARQREQGEQKPVESSNDITGAILNAIDEFCRENGMEFYIVSVPSQPRYIDFLADFSAKNEINYLSLNSAFADLPESDYVIPRDRHWNANGHNIAAHEIDKFLRQQNLFNAKVQAESQTSPETDRVEE